MSHTLQFPRPESSPTKDTHSSTFLGTLSRRVSPQKLSFAASGVFSRSREPSPALSKSSSGFSGLQDSTDSDYEDQNVNTNPFAVIRSRPVTPEPSEDAFKSPSRDWYPVAGSPIRFQWSEVHPSLSAVEYSPDSHNLSSREQKSSDETQEGVYPSFTDGEVLPSGDVDPFGIPLSMHSPLVFATSADEGKRVSMSADTSGSLSWRVVAGRITPVQGDISTSSGETSVESFFTAEDAGSPNTSSPSVNCAGGHERAERIDAGPKEGARGSKGFWRKISFSWKSS
ncbi:hypothetical protein FRC05_009254 [Tulasnella sp. 425]|nr:hypothetical protein FRC05_009254 [Tulasnella sp. 425]